MKLQEMTKKTSRRDAVYVKVDSDLYEKLKELGHGSASRTVLALLTYYKGKIDKDYEEFIKQKSA